MHLRFAILVFLSALPFLGGATPPPVRLTLDEALRLSEEANLSVLIGREAIEQARGEAERERSSLLPRVSLEAEQRRTRSVQVSRSALTVSGPANRFDAVLAGNLSLLNPADIASYRAARQGVGIAEVELRETLQAVLARVGETYFTHLRNLQRISVLDANIARARALLDLARRQLDAGVATQIDVTRSEAQVAQAEQARIQQNTVVFDSELQLKRLLNLEPFTPLELAPFAVRRADELTALEEIDRAVLERRPDYVRATRVLEQTREALRAARLERVGSLGLFGEYGYAGERALDGRTENAWFGGINLSVPVFEGGRIRANQRIVQAAVRAQEYQVRNLTLTIGSEVRLALQDARSRFTQIEVAERSLRLAEDELRLAQIRFERGAADNREVIEAQNRLAVASDNVVEAIFLYNVSRLELARARGEVREILREKTSA
jgi:outer membrane protein TolC